MKFSHNLVTVPKIHQDNSGPFRVYRHPEIKEPLISITTLLGKTNPGKDSGLKRWREDIGQRASHDITEKAKNVGSHTHENLEQLIGNKFVKFHNIYSRSHYNNIAPILEKNLGIIYGIELQLFSSELLIAGTADLIAQYNGKLSIIDYKTKTSPQKPEYLQDHFLQLTAYCIMFQELTGMIVEQIVIIFSVEGDNKCNQIIRKPVNYKPELLKRIEIFKNLNS